MNRRLYAIHRWISALALVQLAIWVISGFFFAVVPMKKVKGTPVDGANTAPLTANEPLLSPNVALARLASAGAVTKLELVGTPRGPVYRAKVGGLRYRIDARSGESRAVDEEEAREIARRDQPGSPEVLDASRIEHDADIEYRDRPLPAWRVRLADDAATVVYVDAVTGEVTARRNGVWRVYDFLWSLHIMDYRGRESFNHPLLIAAASLGILTVASGVVLWMLRTIRWLRGPTKKREAIVRTPGSVDASEKA